jgi:hypothetical protein
VSDDLLPVEFEVGADGGTVVNCRRSGHELRIRSKAGELLDQFGDDVPRRRTSDERHALAPPPTERESLPLAAVILPRPDRDISVAKACRLGSEAGMWLGRCQRIEGWREPEQLRRQFHAVIRVVENVPVYEVWVPWGPPFAPDLAAQVLDACDIATEP